MRELFPEPNRTYKTRENAVKVIQKIEEMEGELDLHWTSGVTESGRFFPLVYLPNTSEYSLFFFIEKGCCVKIGA